MIRPAVLSIAGSDSGGGAGIQADLRAISAFGVHAATAITSVTAQNSRAVTAVHNLPEPVIEAQIDAVMSELHPAVVKIGMLGSRAIVELVARKLEQWAPAMIVLDPVMVSSSGAALLDEEGVDAMRDLLLPMATVVTPNWDEVGTLIRAWPRGMEDMERIVVSFRRLRVRAVLVKGGHLDGDEVIDTLWDGEVLHELRHTRLRDARGHGTGCTLAAAIAAGLALGQPLVKACRAGVAMTHEALEHRYAVGESDEVYLAIQPPAR